MASETDTIEPILQTSEPIILMTDDRAESVSDIADPDMDDEGTTPENITEGPTEDPAEDPAKVSSEVPKEEPTVDPGEKPEEGSEPNPVLKQGWRTTKKGTRFYYIDGQRVRGWQTIEENSYYFKPSNGKMITGIKNEVTKE